MADCTKKKKFFTTKHLIFTYAPCYYLFMNLQKGKLIVVEGTDGSGKTVQSNLLMKKLSKKGHQTQMTDFPQYGKSFFANMIEKYLKGEFGVAERIEKSLESVST